ncbi:MAG: peptide chain release factor N(5)-glutamine methyltransferase [Tannerellaceae bacterium]|nr:peptide chain release factor N(5)-glutamine methyltransferase [Tannerellaceae bacterium]
MTETISFIRNSLASRFPEGEIRSLVRLILEHVTGLPRHQILLNKDKKLSGKEKDQIQEIISRLKQSEPIQYILGKTEFCGITFEVNPAVLIPRPETEELVEQIIRDWQGKQPTIADIGTGSGCIAISLAKFLPDARIYALDISGEAIRTARENACRNEVTLHFAHSDILNTEQSERDLPENLDALVSNPPYVLVKEKKQMEKNVLDFEPHLALFVSDEDPLLFYRAIARTGQHKLREKGTLYLEINGMYGEETVRLLADYGYKKIELKKDLSGKDRIIKASK